MSWTVYTQWRANGPVRAAETAQACPDWLTARRQALSNACCNGARYVQVQGPGDVVVGEYDRYTNHWREYPRALTAETAQDDHTAIDAFLDVLGDVRIQFWVCPVQGHSDRRDPDGRPVVTVVWDGDTARCTYPGCDRTNQPATAR